MTKAVIYLLKMRREDLESRYFDTGQKRKWGMKIFTIGLSFDILLYYLETINISQKTGFLFFC